MRIRDWLVFGNRRYYTTVPILSILKSTGSKGEVKPKMGGGGVMTLDHFGAAIAMWCTENRAYLYTQVIRSS